MGRPNPGFEKRLRERKKAEKKKEKQRRKAERQAQKKRQEEGGDPDSPETDPSDGDDAPRT